MPPVATILVVDDDPAVTVMFERMLVAGGFRVVTAPDAQGALRHLDQAPPDALIVDFRMPRINALGLLYRIRGRRRLQQLPVLVVTGFPLSEDALDEFSALGAAVRYKPLTMTELLESVRRLVPAT